GAVVVRRIRRREGLASLRVRFPIPIAFGIEKFLIERRRNHCEVSQRAVHLINSRPENIADQQIDYVYTALGIFLQKLRKTEAVVIKGMNQLAHRLYAVVELSLELTEPLAGEVIVVERIVDRVCSQFCHLERQQYSRRINRIQKSVCVTDQNKTIACASFRSIRIINYRIDLIHALGAGDAPAARLALLDLFIEDLREVFAAVLCQIIRIGNNSHAGNVVLERDIPEPSTAARRSSQYQSSSAI